MISYAVEVDIIEQKTTTIIGKIYKILNNVNDDVYIGSTCQSLSKRMAKHRESVNSVYKKHRPLYAKMRELGVINFYIELIIEYPCENLEQLHAVEGQYIRSQGTLNAAIAGRTPTLCSRDKRTKTII